MSDDLRARNLLICMDVLRDIQDEFMPTVKAIEAAADRFFVSFSTARCAYYSMKDDPEVRKLIIYKREC